MNGGRRFVARRSGIHGRGVFATRDLAAGEELLEYRGRVLDWDEASRIHEESGEVGVTYLFDLEDGRVIDGSVEGSTARWINHGCTPNCETTLDDGRVWVQTIAPVAAGEELLIDYALVVDDPADPEVRALYACRCGSTGCRGTMVAV